MAWISHLRSWFRSPYGLLGAFFAITLGPALGLVWLGWRLLDQDRALETQRIIERREQAADQLITALQHLIQASEDDLAQLRVPLPGEDVLIAEISASGIRAFPEGSLIFYPETPAATGILSDEYRRAEAYEFQDQNYTKAIAELKPLATSRDPSIRAGACLRIARNQRKAGRFDQAFKSYDELAEYVEMVVAGLPAELVARRSRCTLLAQLDRRSDLLDEAGSYIPCSEMVIGIYLGLSMTCLRPAVIWSLGRLRGSLPSCVCSRSLFRPCRTNSELLSLLSASSVRC